ncbi:uncharacterized protein LOC121860091 isoform X2 [Homarus americanus]|uniref:uncharacterized protein LOC121860091 isoform X2 n=1 Tax=Homarus americanus TaxID=6706 RepID=UPI001C47B1F5|nr:uncharacterized protein LOC121860091 isoform X2 [Homarus americanus]
MEVDQHMMWLISALKASVDDDTVNENKLTKNVSDCFLRVKKTSANGNKDQQFDDFRARATLLLLLCCPRIRELPVIQTCQDFQAVAMTLPVLKESVFFSLVRSQKNYRFLSPVLCWVSPGVLQEITREYFLWVDGVTPLTLAVSLELLKGLLFSFQYNCVEDDSVLSDVECLHLLLKFLSSKNVSSKTQVLIKSSGYYYMYICEYLYLMLTVYAGCCLKEPETYLSLQTWTHLWKSTHKKEQLGKGRCFLFIGKSIESLLNICQQNSEAVNVDVWIEWNDLILPAVVTVHRNSSVHHGKARQKSIQSVICNIAFDILKIFNSHPEIHKNLNTNTYQGLMQFFQHVALDPDYDPDQNLDQDKLIEEISVEDERQAKLLAILARRENIFTSQDCQECMKKYSTVVDGAARKEILLGFIQHVKAKRGYTSEWLDLVLDMVAALPAKHLLPIIEDHLAAGLDETLKTADFPNQLTSIFNQLAAQDSVVPSEKHVWLCLQSGKAVVKQAVLLAVSLSGLIPVMVQALTAIPQVCQAVLPSGKSLLVSTLLEQQSNGFSGRQEQEFAALVKGLLGAENVLAASEVLKVMIEPFLVVTSGKDMDKLTLPLDLLKEIVEHKSSAVVKPGPSLVSLILTLVHIIHATVNLQSHDAPGTLSLRMDAVSAVSTISDNIIRNLQEYEKDISLLKQLMVKYQLHPRSVFPLTKILDLKECQDSYADCIQHAMMKIEMEGQEGKKCRMDCIDKNSKSLIGISRSEWVIALFKLLPHSSEPEWISAFFLTHHALQSLHLVYPTLQVFQEVLYLVCAHMTVGSMAKEEIVDGTPFQPASVSIQHCFRCFATAAMMYLEELLQPLPSDKRFQHIGSIFRWWCHVVSLYQCNSDLPSLFLARLIAVLEEIITSGKLQFSKYEKTQKYCCEETQSDMKGKEENKLQNSHNINVVDKEMVVTKGQGNDLPSETEDKQNEDKEKSRNSLILANGAETYKLQDACDESREMSANKNVESSCLNISNFNNVDISGNKKDNSTIKKKKGNKTNEITKISFMDLKTEIEQMILALVKYVPASNFVGSIASKLKKLNEL